MDRRQSDKLKEFFKHIPLMKLLPRTELNKLDLSLDKKKFMYGQYACHEGTDSEYIFIVISGEFEVSKIIDENEQKNHDNQPEERKKASNSVRRIGGSKGGEHFQQSRVESTKVEFMQSQYRQNAYKRVKIALIGEGQVHGEDDAI